MNDLPRGWHVDGDRVTSQTTPDHRTYIRTVDYGDRECRLSEDTDDGPVHLTSRPMGDGESLENCIKWLERQTPRLFFAGGGAK